VKLIADLEARLLVDPVGIAIHEKFGILLSECFQDRGEPQGRQPKTLLERRNFERNFEKCP